MDYKNVLTNPFYIAVIVVLAATIIFGTLLLASSTPVVMAGDNISVYYTGTFTNGTVFDSNVGSQPLVFTVGAGQLIKGFDYGVIGMKLNQTKTLIIPANDAYGEVNPNLIISVPRGSFGNRTLQIGMTVSETLQSGNQLQGTVEAINGNNVTVNFNPRLAGQTLIFTIRVVKIQKGG